MWVCHSVELAGGQDICHMSVLEEVAENWSLPQTCEWGTLPTLFIQRFRDDTKVLLSAHVSESGTDWVRLNSGLPRKERGSVTALMWVGGGTELTEG